ncbi:MAG: LacI family DNA-binding transcriptional regulator [Lachnospiraceae bacterium]|nr:LacI family DNA-binding transcriptional regulator [Lachnospiraceae bacterium]
MTIREVAALAGVSPAAVSRYMNGGPLSEEKQEKIRRVIDQTGYRPNQIAQSMRTGKGGQIGVIVPRLYSDSVAQVMEGIAEGLQNQNYVPILGCTYLDVEKEISYLEAMQSSQVAGVILMGTILTPALENTIHSCSKPVVVTGQNFAGVPCVYHDDFHAVSELTARMIGTGRQELAFIGVDERDVAVGKNRRLGFEAAAAEAGIRPEKLHYAVSRFDADSGEAAMDELLGKYPGIDGVICATDMIALGAMNALFRSGKRVPEDAGIAGVGDSWADKVARPALTTAHLYFRECGLAAVEILLQRIGNEIPESPVRKTMLEYSIIERGSM